MEGTKPAGWVSAGLYVSSKSVDAETIQKKLDLVPTRVRVKGEPLLDGFNPDHSFIFEITRQFSSDGDDVSALVLQNCMEELLSAIEPRRESLDTLRTDTKMNLMCSYGSTSSLEWLFVDETMLKRIADLKVSLTVCVCQVGQGAPAV